MSYNAHDLSKRLLNALDNSYNVVDMQAVNEIISILEKFNITKELLETTRLGKHVNELRRRSTEPTLARRAKVLVKRWRDLVIPAAAPALVPASAGPSRPLAEPRRRLGGTPLTSPALARHAVSPAAPSPRPPSRPAWGGYESDSNDVIILVDDDPPPAPPAAPPATPAAPPVTPATPAPPTPQKRPPSPTPLGEEKRSKRDKKPKKKRGHSRAGSGSEAAEWTGRNGRSPPAPAAAAAAPAAAAPPRRNGCRPLDAYSALVQRMPPAGAKKVKTTKELLEEIQSRGARPSSPAPASPACPPGSPDVQLIEPDVCALKVDSPLRNGGASPAPAAPSPPPPPPPLPPLEDPREYHECLCGTEQAAAGCPAARAPLVRPLHVHALHHALLPGVNGTRAPPQPHRFAVRAAADPARPGLFASVVPLYNYTDYADDYCVKNMSRVPLYAGGPWTEFAPPPPSPPPRPPPPDPRPYPLDDGNEVAVKVEAEDCEAGVDDPGEEVDDRGEEVNDRGEEVDDGVEEVNDCEDGVDDRTISADKSDVACSNGTDASAKVTVPSEFACDRRQHRTVERTKPAAAAAAAVDGRALYAQCGAALGACPYRYGQAGAAPVLALPPAGAEPAAVDAALAAAAAATARDELGRPLRADTFAEWHECARIGELVALPYVVID